MNVKPKRISVGKSSQELLKLKKKVLTTVEKKVIGPVIRIDFFLYHSFTNKTKKYINVS